MTKFYCPNKSIYYFFKINTKISTSFRRLGTDPGFQVRRAHLKKLRRAEGGANIFGVFRVKNHDFTPKNHIFPMAEGGAKIFGVMCGL
jgi:hypothetical protein